MPNDAERERAEVGGGCYRCGGPASQTLPTGDLACDCCAERHTIRVQALADATPKELVRIARAVGLIPSPKHDPDAPHVEEEPEHRCWDCGATPAPHLWTSGFYACGPCYAAELHHERETHPLMIITADGTVSEVASGVTVAELEVLQAAMAYARACEVFANAKNQYMRDQARRSKADKEGRLLKAVAAMVKSDGRERLMKLGMGEPL